MLFFKRLLNLITKSKLTGKLDQIKVKSVPCFSDGKMEDIKDSIFYASEDYSAIALKYLNQNEFRKNNGTIGIVVDMYHDPSRKDKMNLIFKCKPDSKSITRWEIQEEGTIVEIDGICIGADDGVNTIYEYTLSKFNGLKIYKFKSDEMLDVTLTSGQHIMGYIDTRLMYRRETDNIGIFEHTSLPFKQYLADKQVSLVCIDLSEILSIELLKPLYENSTKEVVDYDDDEESHNFGGYFIHDSISDGED